MIEVETRSVAALGQGGSTGKREVGVAIKEREHPRDDLYLTAPMSISWCTKILHYSNMGATLKCT